MTTTIEWTLFPDTIGETLNPIRARHDGRIGWHCEKASPGCDHCFAERQNLSGRFGGTKLAYRANSPAEVYLDQKVLEKPLHWRKPRTVFLCSMTDLFGKWVPDEWIDQMFATMTMSQQHRFLILTKRPERMALFVKQWLREQCGTESPPGAVHLPNNIGLGVTAEDQQNERIRILLTIPAAMRFVSFEPLLESVVPLWPQWWWKSISWAIVGGETGPGARPMNPDWVRSIRDQCQAAGVPFFFKGWGAWIPNEDRTLMEYDQLATHIDLSGMDSQACGPQYGGMEFYRVGKKQSGRLLDGKEWNEFPEWDRATEGK